MIKNWEKFNEGLFSKKKDAPTTFQGKGVMSSTGRPSEEEIQRIEKNVQKLKEPIEYKIDSDFLQDISDRLYGPDSDEYVKAIKEINQRFRPRVGRYGSQFYDPKEQEKNRLREQEIIKMMKDR